MFWLTVLDNKNIPHYYLRRMRQTRDCLHSSDTPTKKLDKLLLDLILEEKISTLFVFLLLLILAPVEKGGGENKRKWKAPNFCTRMFNKWKEFHQECNRQKKIAIYSRGGEKRSKEWPIEARNCKILHNRSFKRGLRRLFFNIYIYTTHDLVEPNCVSQTFLFPLTSFGDFRSRSGFFVCQH